MSESSNASGITSLRRLGLTAPPSFIFLIMSNSEKQKQANAFRFALANFFEEVAATSNLTDLHTNFQEIFEVLMCSDEADDTDFRNRAVLMLRFTKSFEKHFANIPWQVVDKEACKMKDKVSRKIIGCHAL